MIKFFKNDIVSNPGNPIKPVYKPQVNKDGSITLVVDGYVNTDEEIQSFAESVDIENIVARYLNGDVSALHQHIGQYGDFTNMPKTYAEVLQMQIDARNVFDGLPSEIKAKFNNDPNQFFVQSGSKEWYDKLSPLLPDQKDDIVIKKDEEVKSE